MGVTLLLVIITAVISFFALNNADMMSKWMFKPFMVKKKNEYYRFVSSGFIHADFMHLIFNMFTLYFAGQFLEQVFEGWFGPIGILLFVVMYILGIVVSDIPTYIKHNKDFDYNGLGASGGVAAILFAFILIAPTQEIRIYFIPMPAVVFGVLYLVYSYFQGKRGGDNINHDAHFYGALFGILFTVAVHPSVLSEFVFQILNWR